MLNCQLQSNQISMIEVPLIPWTLRDDHFAVLSADEQARASRYRNASRRRAFIAGRVVLRSALGSHLGIPPSGVQISLHAGGKPHLRHAGELTTQFNISHTHELVIVGLTELDSVGVDVEDSQRPLNVNVLLKNYFSLTECAELLRHPQEERKVAFLRGWTRKEAAWKYFGDESKMRWKNIAVSFDDDEYTHIHLTSDSGVDGTLNSFTWRPTATCVASIVFRGPAATRPRQIPQANNHIGFGRVRQLIWNSET